MGDIYVFGPNEDSNDYSTFGLVGALVPTKCTFKETANGESLVELSHPLDDFGRYTALEKGNILVVPVPVRTTPEIQNGSCVTTVWTYKIKPLSQLTSKNQRTLYKKKTGSGKIKIMPAGTTMTVVERHEDENDRWKVKTQYGTGWVLYTGLELVTEHVIEDNSHAIEEIESPWTVRNQYFRIYETKKKIDSIDVSARHISYDLLYNQTWFYEEESKTLQESLDRVFEEVYAPHDFSAKTNVSNTQSGLFYRNRNIIDVLLNEDDGLCNRYDVGLVRDNYELFFLHDPGINRGVRIQYSKNMTDIEFTDSDDEVITRIVPIGEKKDGKPLYLAETNENNAQCVDSDKINLYPIIHVHELKCENCKIGDKDGQGGKITESVAKARMRQQAEDLFEAECDVPKIEMRVKFVNLGDTEEYKQFKNLENCFLFDYVVAQHPRLNIDVTARIVEIEWDCLLERMDAIEIGSVGKTLANTGICTWQIPSGISGGKIASETIGSRVLKENIIDVRHMQAESVNTDILQAGSVTSEKFDTDELSAEDAGITRLKSTFAKIVGAYIENLQAGDIEADRMGAALANFQQVVAGTAEFDAATIKHLVSNFFNLDGSGSFEDVYIYNLVVTTAQITAAIVQNLALKGDDGHYYRISVSSGQLSPVLIPDSEIDEQAGQTTDGTRALIDSALSQLDMTSGPTIKGLVGVINRIYASIIDTDTLLARKAFVDALYTNLIFSDNSESIQIISQRAQQALNDIQAVVKITPDGVVVSDMNRDADTTKALVAPDGFSVVDKNGQTTASLGLRRQTLGTLTIWETEDGGHAFV